MEEFVTSKPVASTFAIVLLVAFLVASVTIGFVQAIGFVALAMTVAVFLMFLAAAVGR